MKYGYAFVLFSLGLILNGCVKSSSDQTPNRVLENYIQTSFASKDAADREKLLGFLTGDAQARLKAWSDEQFLKAFVENRKKFLGLRILENKKVSEQEAALTYEISYQEGNEDKKVSVSQRKLAAIVFESDQTWRIKEVRTIRESIEYHSELSLP